ncbi:hypothetical protein C5167_008602 [Papaver somniferum]|uniref:Uncharacterized protein n=1 Tax=Papaver somniferum TaxID=3469 RepID=A0A4Y7JV21_PAPSO|nr:hypothetical protein C5167_008602 [Papaver somniferum]
MKKMRLVERWKDYAKVPRTENLGKVTYGANFIEFYAKEAKRIYGYIIPATLTDHRLFVLKQVSTICDLPLSST